MVLACWSLKHISVATFHTHVFWKKFTFASWPYHAQYFHPRPWDDPIHHMHPYPQHLEVWLGLSYYVSSDFRHGRFETHWHCEFFITIDNIGNSRQFYVCTIFQHAYNDRSSWSDVAAIADNKPITIRQLAPFAAIGSLWHIRCLQARST